MDRFQQLRIVEALLFASAEPLKAIWLSERLPEGTDIENLLEELQGIYANRGVNLVRVGEGWAFRTASDLAEFMTIEREIEKKLSRAAVETLSIIAYHQPVTRAEIEEIRGVAVSKGTVDLLLEAGWIRPRGRRRAPGRPVTWGTTEHFLDHFGLESLDALPGVEELKASGLLDRRPGFGTIAMQASEAGEDSGNDEEEDDDLNYALDFEGDDMERIDEEEAIALED